MLAGWVSRQYQRVITEVQEKTMDAQPSAVADGSA
jgi:hypothetical protein